MDISKQIQEQLYSNYLKDCVSEIYEKFPILLKVREYIPYSLGDDYSNGIKNACKYLVEKGFNQANVNKY
ncbi:MAG: hypothetical protein IKA12_03265 [Clostridia bacterium]|nr:hypothetical protein [Clostridia bacterium]